MRDATARGALLSTCICVLFHHRGQHTLDYRGFPLSPNRAVHFLPQETYNGPSFWSEYHVSHNPQSLPLLRLWQSRSSRKEGDVGEFVRSTGATYVTLSDPPIACILTESCPSANEKPGAILISTRA